MTEVYEADGTKHRYANITDEELEAFENIKGDLDELARDSHGVPSAHAQPILCQYCRPIKAQNAQLVEALEAVLAAYCKLRDQLPSRRAMQDAQEAVKLKHQARAAIQAAQ